jgi:hypothetical protein
MPSIIHLTFALPSSINIFLLLTRPALNHSLNPLTHLLYNHLRATRNQDILSKSLTDTCMQKLGTRPRSFISENTCFEFLVQCIKQDIYLQSALHHFSVVFSYFIISISSSVHLSWNFWNNPRGARNRVGIGLSYRPARLHSLAESVPWNRFMGSLKVLKFGLWPAMAESSWLLFWPESLLSPPRGQPLFSTYFSEQKSVDKYEGFYGFYSCEPEPSLRSVSE